MADRDSGACKVVQLPFQDVKAFFKTGQNKAGARPIARHKDAKTTMGPSIQELDSWAFRATCERGAPRNMMLQALTKQANARAPVIAKRMTAGTAASIGALGWLMASNMPRYKSHSLIKPFSGGNPEIAAAPKANKDAVHGILCQSPPNRLISRVCVAWCTEPAPKNSNDLKSPWFPR